MAEHSQLFSSPDAALLVAKIRALSTEMKHHRVFGLIYNIENLRLFMSWHAFAVWDFMSLVKRLQIEFTSVSLPWTPPRSAETARLINEIVLGEETDIAPMASHLSHYELYMAAMEEVGANTMQIRTFIDLVSANMPVEEAMRIVDAPLAVHEFVSSTIKLATTGSIEQVLGSFVFGREDAIPEMFQNLLKTWQINEEAAPIFVFYLQRHIELDTEEHGPAAMRMLTDQVDGDSSRLSTLLESAIFAIGQRIKLWDALAACLEQQHAHSNEAAEVI